MVSPRSISVPMLNSAIFTVFRIARLFLNKIRIISWKNIFLYY
jgi:hypothetical protein